MTLEGLTTSLGSPVLSLTQTQYIARTFTLAAPNLTINGLPVDPTPFLQPSDAKNSKKRNQLASAGPEEQHEPFDGRKRNRVEELAREEEDLLREIAALKRRIPAATAATYAEQFRARLTEDDETMKTIREKMVASSEDKTQEQKKKLLDLTLLERQDGVESSFAGAVASLGKLKREMPATVAKMERARVAGEYVVTER
jgi:kinetochor protein Mis14/NSL1